jgi:predicted membrane channel-forming protein YqfA (hemolysin III family)
MQKRFTELSFIIGLFFTIVSLILLIGYFTNELLSSTKNMYAGISFLVFGLAMILLSGKAE